MQLHWVFVDETFARSTGRRRSAISIPPLSASRTRLRRRRCQCPDLCRPKGSARILLSGALRSTARRQGTGFCGSLGLQPPRGIDCQVQSERGGFRGHLDRVEQLDYALTAMQSRDGRFSPTCRLVAHLTTADGGAFDVGDVHVVPVQSIQDIANEVARHIPGGYSAFGGNDPWPMEFPLCLITASDRGIDRYAVGDVLSRRLERFLRLVRLLTGNHHALDLRDHRRGDAGSLDESGVDGLPGLPLSRKAHRTALVRGRAAIESLGQLLDSMVQMPPKMMVTSFGMALEKVRSALSRRRLGRTDCRSDDRLRGCPVRNEQD